MEEELNEKKRETSENRSDELKLLRKLLKAGDVRFQYKKKDGTKRNAHGTLKDSLIPETNRTDERKTKTSDDVFYYYDLKREDWRCFIKDNFIKIKEDKKK